jgi:hypothetical protein
MTRHLAAYAVTVKLGGIPMEVTEATSAIDTGSREVSASADDLMLRLLQTPWMGSLSW